MIGDRYKHKIRGSTYRILFDDATSSSIVDALDGVPMVVYQCESDGMVWVRPRLEFLDGRFEKLS